LIGKARKKPVVIDFALWDGNPETAKAFIGEHGWEFAPNQGWFDPVANRQVGVSAILIETLEGKMLCEAGSYIIKGVKGEFYPCKADIFAATYDIVVDGYEPEPHENSGTRGSDSISPESFSGVSSAYIFRRG
jgi:hypothetical protein